MKKIYTTIIILLLFISCSKNKDIKGFWHSEHEDYKELLKFEDDLCINYFSYRDTVHYSLSEGKLIWSVDYEKKLNFKVKIIQEELFIYDYEKDSLLVKFQRKKSQNYLFDYLNDKVLNIQLPKGNGKIKRFGTLDYNLDFPLYLTYIEGELISNFNGITKSVDANYYRFLRKNVDIPSSEIAETPISLIADKDVKVKDIILLEKHLRLAGFENIHYLNEIDTYDEVNYIGMWMLPLPQEELDKYDLDFELELMRKLNGEDTIIISKDVKEENTSLEKEVLVDDDALVVVTSDYEGELVEIETLSIPEIKFFDPKLNSKLLEIDKSEIRSDNKKVSLVELENTIKRSLINDSAIFYFITDDSTYQNFISVLDVVYNTTEELRSEYLLEKYNLKYPVVRNNRIPQDEIERKRVTEVKEKYPFRFFRMNYKEYKEVKESL